MKGYAVDGEERIWDLLARGGLHAAAEGPARGRYDGTRDPEGVEDLGVALADALRPHEPTVVMVWEGVADAVLAHVVARELGARIVLAFDADGLVAHTGALARGARVAVLTDTVEQSTTLEAMTTYARQSGAQIAVLALLAAPAQEVLPDVPTVALVQLADPGNALPGETPSGPGAASVPRREPRS